MTALLLPEPQIEECSVNSSMLAQVLVNGTWLQGFGPHANIPPGEYQVRYVASDNCNNQTACETTVRVEDCTPPEVTCVSGDTVFLNYDFSTGDEWVTIFASDLIENYSDNCNGNGSASFMPVLIDKERVYTCDDLGYQTVEVWGTDDGGNQSSCEATFFINPNAGVSDPCGNNDFSLGGQVTNEEGEGISNVAILNSLGANITTDSDGNFTIFLPNQDTIILTPFLDGDDLNGVTTYDLVILTKHILGIAPIESPYKLIAADVNNSGTVTTFDAVMIRKLILFNITEFPDVNSWRFIPKDYVFPDPNNPFMPPFPESIFASPINSPSVDFIGVKMGDLSN